MTCSHCLLLCTAPPPPSLDAVSPVSSTATWLASALPSSVAVVKSFNNLSAYTLIHGDPLTEHMKSVAASDDYKAAQATAELGRAMGLEVGGGSCSSLCNNKVGWGATTKGPLHVWNIPQGSYSVLGGKRKETIQKKRLPAAPVCMSKSVGRSAAPCLYTGMLHM